MDHPPSTGVITFLFTDIEGSTRLWENAPEAMEATLEKHDALLARVLGKHNGHIFKTGGDGFYAAFSSPLEGLKAAIAVQHALQQESWGQTPIRVRMGLHSGEAQARDGDYFGPTLNRVARLMAAGHGGQVLLSQTTRDLVYRDLPADVSLEDLGEQRLKDLTHPERIYQALATGLPAGFPPLRTLEAFRHNLPTQLTPFIGRHKALATVGDLLLKNRLLTLTGPGGIGKTRLSLQAAAENLERFRDGVWFVELAPVTEPALVGKSILNTLGLREEVNRTAQQVLNDFFESRRSLLILDNCEHLVAASAQLAGALLRSCPDLIILTSSREALGVPGETVYEVPTMTVMEAGPTADPDERLRSEAVQLFVERARKALPGFEVTPENAAAVVEVCSRLDGIPLAIELAAARVNMLQVKEIADRLYNALSLLKSSLRGSLPHHQTLHAAIDWSYDLLSDPEKILLNRLSVFVGGWTLEAAEQVCVGAEIPKTAILDLLTGLSGKSLVRIERKQGRQVRYHFLDTIRQYALQKLDVSGNSESFKEKHLAYFLELAEQADRHYHGGKEQDWIAKIEREHENMQTALERSLEKGIDRPSGIVLASHLSWFWYANGYLKEGRDWLLQANNFPEAKRMPSIQAKIMWMVGVVSAFLGDLKQAHLWNDRASEIFREMEDDKGLINTWVTFGAIAYFQRSGLEEAWERLEKSIALSAQISYRWGAGNAYHMMGHIAALRENVSESQAYFEKSVDILRALSDSFSLVHPLNDLARLERRLGNLETALSLSGEMLELTKKLGYKVGKALTVLDIGKNVFFQGRPREAGEHFQESLRIAHDVGAKLLIISSLTTLAFVWQASGHEGNCALLLGAVESMREELGHPLSAVEKFDYDQLSHASGLKPNRAIFKENYRKGKQWTREQAIALALEDPWRKT